MNPGVDSAANAALGLLSFVLLLGVYVWVALALSAMFRKMGEEAWRGWVPFLNIATVLKWGGFSPWFVLFALIPGLGQVAVAVLVIISAHRINPGFGYGGGMTVIAAFLFPVWATILGFGPAPWRGARPVQPRPTSPPTGASPPYAPFTAAPPAWPGGLATPPAPAITTPPPLPPVHPAAAQPASTAPQPWAPPPPSGPIPAAASRADAAPPPPATGMPPGHEPTAPLPNPRSTPGWPTEVDEVSAVSPAPFPPSAAPSAGTPAPADGGAIISEVPGSPDAAPFTRLRAAPTGASAEDGDAFPELTGEVSAVVGSPAAGAPVSATRSVAAQQRDEAAASDGETEVDEVEDETVMVRRKRSVWELVPPSGAPIPLEADVVILGRHPATDPRHPRAQLVTIIDPTRTVSKTHARLERRGDTWHITDLQSTNGVLLPSLLGSDIELEPGSEVEVADRFLLGDAALRLQRIELDG